MTALKYIVVMATVFLISCSAQERGELRLSITEVEGKLSISIDGKPVKQDGYQLSIPLSPGEHTLKIEIAGKENNWIFSAKSNFTIVKGETTHLIPELERHPTEKYKKAIAKEGEVLNLSDAVAKDNNRYKDNGDNTVTDTTTKLMWKKCAEGLFGDNCEQGLAIQHEWKDAQDIAMSNDFAGYKNWRLPTYFELRTLVDCSDGKQPFTLDENGYLSVVDSDIQNGRCLGAEFKRPTINQTMFPNTPAKRFWAATLLVDYPLFAWDVHFNLGSVYYDDISNDNRFRLVRSIN